MHYSLVRRDAREGGLGWAVFGGGRGLPRNKQGGERGREIHGGSKEPHILLNDCECQIFCIHNESVRFSAIKVCGFQQFVIN